MLRILLTALLVGAATVAGAWGAMTFRGGADPAGPAGHGSTTRSFVSPEIGVLPLIVGDRVTGYLIGRFTFVASQPSDVIDGVPADVFLSDGFYQATFNAGLARLDGEVEPDAARLATLVLDKVNALAGEGRFSDVYVLQVDLFEKAQVLQKQVEERVFPD